MVCRVEKSPPTVIQLGVTLSSAIMRLIDRDLFHLIRLCHAVNCHNGVAEIASIPSDILFPDFVTIEAFLRRQQQLAALVRDRW